MVPEAIVRKHLADACGGVELVVFVILVGVGDAITMFQLSVKSFS